MSIKKVETNDMENEFIFTSRYGPVKNEPDPKTVCHGLCEGMGIVPRKIKKKWHFVTCHDCSGTGKNVDITKE